MDQLTRPEEPWFDHLKKFVDQGVSAFKMDGARQVNEHPDRKWGNGMDDEEMHNLYPTLLNQQMHQGFREHTGRRPMIYSSGGYTGLQQYRRDMGRGHRRWTETPGFHVEPRAVRTCQCQLRYGCVHADGDSFWISAGVVAGLQLGLLAPPLVAGRYITAHFQDLRSPSLQVDARTSIRWHMKPTGPGCP